MFNFEHIYDFGLKQFDTVSSTASSTATRFQAITAEALDYSTKSFDRNRAFAEKVLQVKNPSEFVELQTSFARESYENLMTQVTKLNKLYFDLGKESLQRWTEQK